MARSASAKRHAQAVFQVARDRNELARWRTDLATMCSVLKDPQLVALLENPKLPLGEKVRILQATLPAVSPLAMNLACLLVAKKHLRILSELSAEYEKLMDAHQGREQAKVISAITLEEEDKRKVGDHLAKLTRKEIVLSAEVEPGIVGGLVIRVGDRLIDGSVRTRIQELKRRLL